MTELPYAQLQSLLQGIEPVSRSTAYMSPADFAKIREQIKPLVYDRSAMGWPGSLDGIPIRMVNNWDGPPVMIADPPSIQPGSLLVEKITAREDFDSFAIDWSLRDLRPVPCRLYWPLLSWQEPAELPEWPKPEKSYVENLGLTILFCVLTMTWIAFLYIRAMVWLGG